MTDNQTDDRPDQVEREGFFANGGGKMVIGRFLAVGLFVALGTFAVIQSLGSNETLDADAIAAAEADADSDPQAAAAKPSVVPASGQEEISKLEKPAVGSADAQFTKSNPATFSSAAVTKPDTFSPQVPAVRSSSRQSQSGGLSGDTSTRKPFVASKPATQDGPLNQRDAPKTEPVVAKPSGINAKAGGFNGNPSGFNAKPPEGRIAQRDTGSPIARFGSGAPAKPTADNPLKRAANSFGATVSEGAFAAEKRFGNAAADLKDRADSATNAVRDRFAAPQSPEKVADQGESEKRGFSTGAIKPIEANSKLNSLANRPFGTRPTIGGRDDGASASRFSAQPMTSISQTSPADLRSGSTTKPPAQERPRGAATFPAAAATTTAPEREDPFPARTQKPTSNVPPRGFGPSTSAPARTPATMPTTAANRTAAPAIQASSVSAVPGDRRFDGVQSTGLILQKSSPREIQVNDTADFEINIKNVGRVELEDVRVIDKVPAGVTFIDSDPKPASSGRMGDLQWNMGTLKPGEERKILIQLKPTRPGEIGSTAQVYSAARASMRTLVTEPKLKISHTADPKVLVGDNVVFNVVVENTGNGPAKDVIIQEEVPDLLEYQDGSRELEYEIGTLLPGQSRRVQLGLRAAKVGQLRNVMFASARGGLQAKHEANVEIVAAKLETTSSGPTLRYIQRQVAHTFTVANKGTADATRLQLIARLPSGLRFVNADNRGRYDSNSHSVVWQMTEMKPGVTGNVELVTLPTGAGPQNIKFEAMADRNLKSSTVQELQIEHLVDIFIDIDDVIDPIEIGGNTSYRIRVANQGTQTAGNVQIQVDFPAGLQPTAVDGSLRNEIRGQQVLFEPITSLRPGDEVGVTIRATGKTSGDHRIAVNMKTDGRVTPVTKEETTKVYADR